MPMVGRKFVPKITRARVAVAGFSADTMARIGHTLNNDIQRRFDAAQDVYDHAAPPLKENYAKYKEKGKYHGIPIRNLQLSGQMRRSMTLLSAQQNRAVIGFTNPVAQQKMVFNQRRSRMYGVSPENREVLVDTVNQTIRSGQLVQVKVG